MNKRQTVKYLRKILIHYFLFHIFNSLSFLSSFFFAHFNKANVDRSTCFMSKLEKILSHGVCLLLGGWLNVHTV